MGGDGSINIVAIVLIMFYVRGLSMIIVSELYEFSLGSDGLSLLKQKQTHIYSLIVH